VQLQADRPIKAIGRKLAQKCPEIKLATLRQPMLPSIEITQVDVALPHIS
jgi:hypothetical protein